MDKDLKKSIAIFRFGVIADLAGRKLNHGEKERLLREKTSYVWDIPCSWKSSIVGRSTIFYQPLAGEVRHVIAPSDGGSKAASDLATAQGQLRDGVAAFAMVRTGRCGTDGRQKALRGGVAEWSVAVGLYARSEGVS